MKRYGLRIGNVGVEFTSVDERDKALRDFTKGVDVTISSEGIRFSEGEGNFSVYERETKETLTNCCKCKGVFGIDSCIERNYPRKHSWEKTYGSETGYICDACLARLEKEKKVYEAQQIVSESKND